MAGAPLLEVSSLSKWFPVKNHPGRGLRAVHNVSFSLGAGRTLGLVGESGCGKSTTGRLVLRLIEPDEGTIRLYGDDITSLRGTGMIRLREQMQIVFQDPLGSLNPRHTVGDIIAEPLLVHGVPARQRRERLAELLREVELAPEMARRYPHEFSGGQRQRIAIARALALNPALIVADEPVSALDASIQSQILMLLKRLQEQHNIALLFISHDLSVVRFICHDVAVMYLGEIVEHGPVERVFYDPQHPYTQALLAAIPRPEPDSQQVVPLEGSLPSSIDPPEGCPFASRCKHVMDKCISSNPPRFDMGTQHISRCWLNEKAAATSERR